MRHETSNIFTVRISITEERRKGYTASIAVCFGRIAIPPGDRIVTCVRTVKRAGGMPLTRWKLKPQHLSNERNVGSCTRLSQGAVRIMVDGEPGDPSFKSCSTGVGHLREVEQGIHFIFQCPFGFMGLDAC